MSYIDIKDLSYSYAGTKEETLKHISLSIDKGEIFLIAGKSGSGKSSLARCIAGSIPNFYGGKISGNINISNKSILHMGAKELSAEVTMVFQDPERQLMMNKVHREIAFALENIAVPSKDIKRRVFETMDFLNILDLAERDVTSLSGGQKQKVVIASALAMLPSAIILDEPISQLDPASAEEVISLIKKINEELGITIIVIEQRIDKWFDIADRLLIMDNGKISFLGHKEDLYKEKIYYDMLPQHLKLAKALDIKENPKGLKELRKLILKEFVKDVSTTKHREIKEERKSLFKNLFSSKSKVKEDYVLSIKDLTVNYGEIKALEHINLNIKEGEFLSILGTNGAGKSTLLKSIMSLINYRGKIHLYGTDMKNINKTEIYKNIAYISQNPNDYISKDTVYEEIKFTLDNYGIKDEASIDKVLKDLNIYELKHRNPRDISGGERQRVAIASMLVLNPNIILLDEPTRGLDYGTKESLGKLLLEFNKKGSTILLVTHDVEFAAKYCKSFVLMLNKAVAAQGTIEEVLKDGIYYTTVVHKLFKDINKELFTLEDVNQYRKSLREVQL